MVKTFLHCSIFCSEFLFFYSNSNGQVFSHIWCWLIWWMALILKIQSWSLYCLYYLSNLCLSLRVSIILRHPSDKRIISSSLILIFLEEWKVFLWSFFYTQTWPFASHKVSGAEHGVCGWDGPFGFLYVFKHPF